MKNQTSNVSIANQAVNVKLAKLIQRSPNMISVSIANQAVNVKLEGESAFWDGYPKSQLPIRQLM